MTRFLLAAGVLAVLPLGLLAGETTVRLSVSAMPAPKPALKYLLLPEVRELNHGNPVQWYIRCFQEQRNFFFSKPARAERTRYLTMPLAELPADKLRDYGRGPLNQADFAARLDTPDWEVLQKVQSGGTDLRLAELGPLRILGEALQVRFRGAVAGRGFDDAVSHAKTMFALARHLGKCPAGAANRLGLVIAEQALDTLVEMVQQPGCPNLYWALTDLPAPLVELRKGFQGDSVLAATDLKGVRDDPMTDAEIEAVVRRLSGVIGFLRQQAGRKPRSLRAALRTGSQDSEKVRAARGRLLDSGRTEDALGKLSPTQVLLLDDKRDFEERRDERLKLLALAPWQINRAAGKEADNGFFSDLLPDVLTARRAQGRLEQRIALLRHVEAVRMYAAAHGGKLPAKLSDCPVPLPADPFTGKAFRCAVEGGTVHLRGGSSPDEVHYRITLK